MKITIDTKEDSHEDIKKVVRMLEALLEGHIAAPMGMFGSPDIAGSSGSDGSSTSSPGTDLFSLFDSGKAGDSGTAIKTDENKDDDIPELVPY